MLENFWREFRERLEKIKTLFRKLQKSIRKLENISNSFNDSVSYLIGGGAEIGGDCFPLPLPLRPWKNIYAYVYRKVLVVCIQLFRALTMKSVITIIDDDELMTLLQSVIILLCKKLLFKRRSSLLHHSIFYC